MKKIILFLLVGLCLGEMGWAQQGNESIVQRRLERARTEQVLRASEQAEVRRIRNARQTNEQQAQDMSSAGMITSREFSQAESESLQRMFEEADCSWGNGYESPELASLGLGMLNMDLSRHVIDSSAICPSDSNSTQSTRLQTGYVNCKFDALDIRVTVHGVICRDGLGAKECVVASSFGSSIGTTEPGSRTLMVPRERSGTR